MLIEAKFLVAKIVLIKYMLGTKTLMQLLRIMF